jgi:hypothetical protein
MASHHHDTGYKEVFSHPEFVQQLIEGFMPHEIAQIMDFSTLRNHSGNYITPLFEEKFEDVVWSVEISWEGVTQRVYLYILLDKFIGNEFGRTSVRPKGGRHGWRTSVPVPGRSDHADPADALHRLLLRPSAKAQGDTAITGASSRAADRAV